MCTCIVNMMDRQWLGPRHLYVGNTEAMQGQSNNSTKACQSQIRMRCTRHEKNRSTFGEVHTQRPMQKASNTQKLIHGRYLRTGLNTTLPCPHSQTYFLTYLRTDSLAPPLTHLLCCLLAYLCMSSFMTTTSSRKQTPKLSYSTARVQPAASAALHSYMHRTTSVIADRQDASWGFAKKKQHQRHGIYTIHTRFYLRNVQNANSALQRAKTQRQLQSAPRHWP